MYDIGNMISIVKKYQININLKVESVYEIPKALEINLSLFYIREIYKVYYEEKDNQFYYVIKHSQVECTQKALIFIYGPGKRTEVWRKWEDYGLFLFYFWNEPVETIPYTFWAGE